MSSYKFIASLQVCTSVWEEVRAGHVSWRMTIAQKDKRRPLRDVEWGWLEPWNLFGEEWGKEGREREGQPFPLVLSYSETGH